MGERHNTTNTLLSVSLFCLAGAIVYFGYTLSQTVEKLPKIVDQLDEAARFMYPVLDQVELVTDLVPEVIQEVEQVRLAIPPILEEIEALRLTVPPILEEVEAMRMTVPPILTETEAIRNSIPSILEQIENARMELASIVDESAQIREQIPAILEEMDEYRTVIAEVLVEVRTTRQSLPATLDRAAYLIAEANSAGQQASEGAITGVLTGILKAPFSLISSAGSSIFPGNSDISDEDRTILERDMQVALSNNPINETRTWINSNGGRGGELTILSERYLDDRLCKVLRVTAIVDNGEPISAEAEACLDPDGTWVAISK